jgi:8-oxo-dGTP pyrophosphatase MutT (NUDIX family)
MPEDAIPAATLILIRQAEGDNPPELLMVERSQGMAFAAGAMVFPGGRIDAADEALAASIGTSPAAVAAVRETIEETAVPAGIAPVPSPEEAKSLQASLIAGRDFGDLLHESSRSFVADALVPFARWVPQFHAVRRFDTMFYVALCPEGEWSPNVIQGECAGAVWISAADVLERERSGQARLIFPTRRTLERLARHCSFQDIRADAEAHPIAPITPWVEERDGERFITIPADAGFPVTQERLDGLWRG